MSLENIFNQKSPRSSEDNKISIIWTYARYILFHNIFATNLAIEQFNLIELQNCIGYKLERFFGINITVFNFMHSLSAQTFLLQIHLQQLSAQQHLFQIEPDMQDQQIFIEDINLYQCKGHFIAFNIKFMQSFNENYLILRNMIFNQIQASSILQIVSIFSTIQIENLQIVQSQLLQIIDCIGKNNYFLLQYIKIKEVDFGQNNISLTLDKCNSITLFNILFTRVQNLSVYLQTQDLYVENLLVKDSLMADILFTTVVPINQINYAIINKILIINNIASESNNLAFVRIVLQNQINRIIDIRIHQNRLDNSSVLLVLFDKLLIMSMSVTNNKCGLRCLVYAKNSEMKFKDLKLFGNQYYMNPLKDDDQFVHLSNFLDEQNPQERSALQINQNIININKEKELLYLPSGQKLIEYKVFDYINNKLENQIKLIRIITTDHDNKQLQISGNFSINVFECDPINYNIISDRSQFQNFQQFEQTNTSSGLANFKIIFNPYSQNILMLKIQQLDQNIQPLIIYAKTQICQMGEIFVKDACLICRPELQVYSLKQKSNFCSVVDEQIIIEHISGAVKLRNGFWRPFIYNPFIEQCDSIYEKCKGGWHTGDMSCKIGYIGAVCNACDIYNIRGDGYYLQEYSQCKFCGELKYFYFLSKLTSVIIILCIKLALQLRQNILSNQKLLLQKLVNYRHFHILSKYISDIPSLFFTILIGNLAILKFIIQDSVDLPDVLTIFTNPVIIQQNSFMCIQKYTNLNYSYWINYYKLIIPILIYNIFVIIMAIVLKRRNNIKTYFLFPIISLFLSQGPTLLVLFIQQTLYTTYSNIKYTTFDQSIRYFSKIHQKNLKLMIFPIIIIMMIIIPLMLTLLIRKQVRNMFKDKFIQIGNFILPFKSNYQEVLNYYKNSIILLLLSFNDKQLTFQNKTAIITVILYLNFKNVYKIKFISKKGVQSGICLIIILYFTNFMKQLPFLSKFPLLMILAFSFVIHQFKIYINLFYNQNKLQLFELMKNSNNVIKYLELKKYIQCLQYWKMIKKNHKIIVQYRAINQQSINDIILETVQTKMTSNSLVEIEMIQL